MGKRIYPLNRIKYWFCYDIEDICALYKEYGLNPQTVRKWIKKGLKTIDNKQPFLIYGYYLKEFLGNQNQANKSIPIFNKIFCMSCKEHKDFYKNQIQLIPVEQQFIKIKAHCRTCKGEMYKSYKLTDLPELKRIFVVVDVLQLYDCKNSPLNTHILNQGKSSKSEPSQMELF